jgi:hypothetical protein
MGPSWMSRVFSVVVLCAMTAVALSAQAPQQQPTNDTVDELKALVFVLQTRLADVERELGEEKKRRAELEAAELKRARETLEPGVKRKLGLPVPDTKAVPAEKTPPKN